MEVNKTDMPDKTDIAVVKQNDVPEVNTTSMAEQGRDQNKNDKPEGSHQEQNDKLEVSTTTVAEQSSDQKENDEFDVKLTEKAEV
jgi:hypothetical protein